MASNQEDLTRISESSASIPYDMERLLAVMEAANNEIEADSKSLNSLSGMSRKNSTASLASASSEASTAEEDSWTLWGHIVNNWDNSKKESLDSLVIKGVPTHFRAIVWQLLCEAEKLPEKKLYSGYMTIRSPYERQIRRDINRTFPEVEYFQDKDGQEALFNVIKAYALHDREVGYCQGTAFIIGLLLMHMPEEEAFSVTVQIMQKHGMREMYKPPMQQIGLCFYQLDNLIKDLIPELHHHFTHQGVQMSMFASSWFLTIYSTVLSINLSCRIMDIFLLRGMDIIFQVALALLTMCQKDLLQLDMEGIQMFLQKDMSAMADEDQEGLINVANSFKINLKKMKKFEKQYMLMKSKENEYQGELRKLRSENRSLRCVVDNLELESASLAEKLVRYQVEAAKGAETEFSLQQKLLDAEKRLQIARDNHEHKSSSESSLEYVAVNKHELSQREEMIDCLQKELVRVRLIEAENEVTIKDLKARVNELELDQKRLREVTVDNSVARLQEELIAVKMREAEANAYLMESRQSLMELTEAWEKHLQEHKSEVGGAANSSPDSLSTSKKLLRAWENRSVDIHKIEEDLMSARIKEANALSDLRIMNLKVMELETQVQVSLNQLRRQDSEKKILQQELEEATNKVKYLSAKKREQDHKLSDMLSKHQCEQMMANIKGAEDSQKIAELNQKISSLKLCLAEVRAERQLLNNSDMNHMKHLSSEVLNGNNSESYIGALSDLSASQEALFDEDDELDTGDADKTLTPSKMDRNKLYDNVETDKMFTTSLSNPDVNSTLFDIDLVKTATPDKNTATNNISSCNPPDEHREESSNNNK